MTKLFYTIGLVLLLVGVAAADERHKPGDVWPKGDGCNTCEMDQFGTSSCTVMYCKLQDIYTDCLHKTPYGETIDICRTPDMRKILSESQSCEQKMKEAMKLIWPYIDYGGVGITGDLLYRSPQTRLREEADRLDKRDAALRKWEAIYQECVK